jgi:hypothetical protein
MRKHRPELTSGGYKIKLTGNEKVFTIGFYGFVFSYSAFFRTGKG